VSGQLHAPARKEPVVPLGGPQGRSGRYGEAEIAVYCWEASPARPSDKGSVRWL
jgi:hypothetical protein